MIVTTLLVLAGAAVLYLSGLNTGYNHGVRCTEERWSDAVRRVCRCTERLP